MSDEIVLLGQGEILGWFQQHFRPGKGQRIAITAFVGNNAAELLGDPAGVEVYCTPAGACTSADGVAELLRQGARVWFVEKLHTKIYGVVGGRCLVGSANLSQNGVGGELIEHMLDVPEALVGVEDVVDGLVGAEEVHLGSPKLDVLRRDNHRTRHRDGMPDFVGRRRRAPTFGAWWKAPDAARDEKLGSIRLAWFAETRDVPEPTRKAAREAGHREPVSDWTNSVAPALYPKDSWVLCVPTTADGTPRWDDECTWLRVDGTHELTEAEAAEEEEDGRHVAYQLGDAPKVPFKLDKPTQSAIREAWTKTRPLRTKPPGENWLAGHATVTSGRPSTRRGAS